MRVRLIVMSLALACALAFVMLACWAGQEDMPLTGLLALLGGTLSACYAEHQIHAMDALERRERREEGKR